jgi:hypothetical protein
MTCPPFRAVTRRSALICALLLSACGPAPQVLAPPPLIPADLLSQVPGWRGAPPATEEQWARAALAEQKGRKTCNLNLRSIGEIVQPAP